MGIVLRYSSLHQHNNTNQENELLFGHNPDSAPHPGAYYRCSWTLLQPLQTFQECLQQPRLRLAVLHTGCGSHGRGAHRGGHQRPRETIFAPTNDAFAKIPSDALTGLLADVPALTEVLLRHVVPGKTVKLYKAEQSVDNAGGSKVTLNGYRVATSAGSANVNAKVMATDGIIYAIDSVV